MKKRDESKIRKVPKDYSQKLTLVRHFQSMIQCLKTGF